jgi:hypothetical protein
MPNGIYPVPNRALRGAREKRRGRSIVGRLLKSGRLSTPFGAHAEGGTHAVPSLAPRQEDDRRAA